MKRKSLKVGDKVKAVEGYYKTCKTMVCLTITSISPDGAWLGFNIPGAHDDEDIESGLVPNYPADCFELLDSSEFN